MTRINAHLPRTVLRRCRISVVLDDPGKPISKADVRGDRRFIDAGNKPGPFTDYTTVEVAHRSGTQYFLVAPSTGMERRSVPYLVRKIGSER